MKNIQQDACLIDRRTLQNNIKIKCCKEKKFPADKSLKVKKCERPPDSHGGGRKTKTEPGLGWEAIFVELVSCTVGTKNSRRRSRDKTLKLSRPYY